MQKEDWKTLLGELKAGNNEVLGIFYKRHASYCFERLSRENKCSPEDAEDIFVEAVLSMREKLLGGKEDMILNVRAYLYRVCYNMFLTRLRQEKRAQRKLKDIERFYYDSIYVTENELFDNTLLERTMKAWQRLSERCRDILYLFYVDKLRMNDITGLMGFANANVVKTTKARCYKKWVDFVTESDMTGRKEGNADAE